MSAEPFKTVLSIVDRLRNGHIYCELTNCRNDAISVLAVVPGQHWEIDVLSDGTLDVEIYTSDGTIYGEQKLDELVNEFSE